MDAVMISGAGAMAALPDGVTPLQIHENHPPWLVAMARNMIPGGTI